MLDKYAYIFGSMFSKSSVEEGLLIYLYYALMSTQLNHFHHLYYLLCMPLLCLAAVPLS